MVLTQIAPSKYRFAHALIREVLTSDLPVLARAEIHHRIGLALELFDDAASALAFHFEQASPVLGSAREPIRYALEAARAAMARHAYEQARDHCLGALSLANDRGSSVHERGRILAELGEAQRCSGALDDAKATFSGLAELGRSSRTPALIAEAALGYGRTHKENGLLEQPLVALLEEALGALPPGEDRTRAELLGTLARALIFDPLAPERRVSLSLEALEIARRNPDRSTLSLVLASRVYATWGARDPEIVREWPRVVDAAVGAAEQARHYESLMEMRVLAVTAALQAGTRAEALASLELAEHLAQRLQHPSQLYFIASARSALALYEGRLDEVPALKARAHALGQPLGRVASVFDLLQTIVLAREAGDMNSLVERAPAIALATNSALAARTAVLWIYTEAGMLDVAQSELSNLSVPLLTSAFDANWLSWYVVLGRALVELSASTLCDPLYRELLPFAGLVAVCGSVGAVLGHVSLTLGVLARQLGELDAACDHLQSALKESRVAGARPEQARAHLELARTLELLGRRREARSELIFAEQLASEVGMKKVLSDVAALRGV